MSRHSDPKSRPAQEDAGTRYRPVVETLYDDVIHHNRQRLAEEMAKKYHPDYMDKDGNMPNRYKASFPFPETGMARPTRRAADVMAKPTQSTRKGPGMFMPVDRFGPLPNATCETMYDYEVPESDEKEREEKRPSQESPDEKERTGREEKYQDTNPTGPVRRGRKRIVHDHTDDNRALVVPPTPVPEPEFNYTLFTTRRFQRRVREAKCQGIPYDIDWNLQNTARRWQYLSRWLPYVPGPYRMNPRDF